MERGDGREREEANGKDSVAVEGVWKWKKRSLELIDGREKRGACRV
jgi:hypothetical protein